MSDCITKEIGGNWLTNDHLEVCFLKLTTPTNSQMKNDESRVENTAILTKLLKANDEAEVSLLELEVSNKPVLIIAPELAFGSSDYGVIETLIRQYSHNLIFICGFGFSAGEFLNGLVSKDNVEGIWQSPVNNLKKYNGGWVWVKD